MTVGPFSTLVPITMSGLAGEELGVAEHNRITFFKDDVAQTFEVSVRSHRDLSADAEAINAIHQSRRLMEDTMWKIIFMFIALVLSASIGRTEDLGNLSANRFDIDSSSNRVRQGQSLPPNGINNPFSPYGSPFSNQSATNPFATRTRPDSMTSKEIIGES